MRKADVMYVEDVIKSKENAKIKVSNNSFIFNSSQLLIKLSEIRVYNYVRTYFYSTPTTTS